MVRVHEDGHSDIFREVDPAVICFSNGPADTRIMDQAGNIVSDSQRDRVNKQQALADLITAHSGDAVLTALLASYQKSIHDADNELVHLYEIRDALKKRVGGESKTRAALGISDTDWRRLGSLCNVAPLRQGRHRGRARMWVPYETQPTVNWKRHELLRAQ